MQDDDREKTAEIMQMDEIYFNSMLNISATEGQSSEGLVFSRKLLRMNPCRSTVQIPESQECLDLTAFPERWFLRPGEAPLNNRGWVFQERTLAPRIVHFAKDQVFWECHSLLASEVLPQGLPCAMALHSTKGIGLSPNSGNVLQIRSRWYELIEEYSRTSVTFPEDRLLAVSAVAKRFCYAMSLDPSTYVAGMWKDDLPLSMLWSQEPLPGTAGPEPASIGREVKCAPSWSWASVLATVVMVASECLVVSTEVLGLELTRKSPNLFDGTESCRLLLRGPLTKLCQHLRDGEAWVQIGQDAEFRVFHEFEFQQGSSIIIWWDTAREIDANEFFLLHIASEHSVDGRIERGVVLRKATDRGSFCRVGSFMVPFVSKCLPLDIERAFKNCSLLLGEDDFLERRLSGKCVIEVI
ncbi:Heterokaryon incompatibility [Akanthomyces lecanii RCEF 1005]|uniref:Heterokaryon incompatibility n=1 Tax=Akanthomyces lecanii RCEF 1005 TaxID=1081108 RepID=A0A168BE85_CORDF|nr:Heterokaryon incompatibility [Akanthomyces lecanii RCEF 1005]